MSQYVIDFNYILEHNPAFTEISNKDPETLLKSIIYGFFDNNILPNFVGNPLINQQICSMSQSRGGKKQITMDNDYFKIIVARMKTYNLYFDFKPSTYISKPTVCFFTFLMQCIKRDQSILYDLCFDPINKNVEIASNSFTSQYISKIIDLLMKFSKNNETSGKFAFYDHIKSVMKIEVPDQIKNRIKSFKDMTVDDLETLPIIDLYVLEDDQGNKYPSIMETDDFMPKNIWDYLNTLNIPYLLDYHTDTYDTLKSDLEKKKTIKKNLSTLNPVKCTVIQEDIYTLTPFKEFTLQNLNSYFQISGRCYTFEYIGDMMFASKGIVDFNGAKVPKYLPQIFARYYTHGKDDDGKLLINKFIEQYNALHESLKSNFASVSPMPAKLTPSSDTLEKDVEDRVDYILNKLQGELANQTITKVIERTAGTIFDLFGLFGYTLISDYMYVQANNQERDGTEITFEVSTKCAAKLTEMVENLIQLGINMQDLSVNEKTFKDLMSGIAETCIHGTGHQFMKFFILATVQKHAYVTKMKELIETLYNHDDEKPIQDVVNMLGKLGYTKPGKFHDFPTLFAFIDDVFKDPPFLIEAPSSFKKFGYMYLTCFRDDLNHSNMLNTEYTVKAYTAQGEPLNICYILCRNCYVNSCKPDDLSCFNTHAYNVNKSYNHEFLAFAGKQSAELTKVIESDNTLLMKLVRIPYVFQRNRYELFDIYSEYVLNICKVCSDDKKYEPLRKLYQHTSYDYIEMENIAFPMKKFCAIGKYVENNVGKHIFEAGFNYEDPSNTSAPLDSIARLTYQPGDQPTDPPCVRFPINRQIITHEYQYYKLLSSMIYPDLHFDNIFQVPEYPKYQQNRSVLKLDDAIILNKCAFFEKYYHLVFGQSSQLRQILFSNIKLTIGTQTWEKGQFSRMKFKDHKEIINIIGMTTVQANDGNLVRMFTDFCDLLESIDGINCFHILPKLIKCKNNFIVYHSSVSAKVKTGLKNIIKDIEMRMEFAILLMREFYEFVLPNNNTTLQNKWPKYPFDNFNSEHGDAATHFVNKYRNILNAVIDITIQHGHQIPSLQYNFTEIQKEVYLIKHFKDKKDTEIIKFFNYYNGYVKDKNKDKQELDKLVFEYKTKVKLIELHETMMQYLAVIENLLAYACKSGEYKEYKGFENLQTNALSNVDQVQEHVGQMEENVEEMNEAEANVIAMLVPNDREKALALLEMLETAEFQSIQAYDAADDLKKQLNNMIHTNIYDKELLQYIEAVFVALIDE